MAAAWTEPVSFVRVVASLIPRDIEITVTTAKAERLSDDDLAGYLEGPNSENPSEAQEDAEVL
jgi:hypothetical protein